MITEQEKSIAKNLHFIDNYKMFENNSIIINFVDTCKMPVSLLVPTKPLIFGTKTKDCSNLTI